MRTAEDLIAWCEREIRQSQKERGRGRPKERGRGGGGDGDGREADPAGMLLLARITVLLRGNTARVNWTKSESVEKR